MVGAAAIRISGTFYFPCVLNLGCISGNSLLAQSKWRKLSFAVLFAGTVRQLTACNFWTEARLVAIVGIILTRAFGSVGAGGFSAHLLLLPRRLLQSVLGRPTRLCCWRAAKGISGRKFIPAHHAKHSP